ncbi:unnamed protein product [Phaedon cochleariae]|uniref:Protein LSM14 homolog B n=1 Tax=Phaedon cochleariae TaxID=80249 RepID=A0A9P0DRG4_PHACE|nr:unnamed protein product [Phaedon cochleariae]
MSFATDVIVILKFIFYKFCQLFYGDAVRHFRKRFIEESSVIVAIQVEKSSRIMTTGMPELGSKISLISKADIRYEGRLFTVDPQECTIALASVRSFGTEDRETQYPVPAQNQVYDYILFRGSDIKDIRVINNVAHPQPLNDPAIMQLSVPPTLGGQTFQAHPVLGPMGPQMGQFGGAYGAIGAAMGGLGAGMGPGLGSMQRDSRGMGNSKASELIMGGPAAPGVLSPPIEPPAQVNHASVLDLIGGGGGGSRSTTPVSVGSRKSPTADQGVQAGGGGGGPREDKKVVRPIQPPGQQQQRNGQSQAGQGQQQRRKSRERRGSSKDRDENNRSVGNRSHQQNNQGYHQNNHGYHHQNSQGGYHQNSQGYPQNNQGYQQQHQGYNSNYRMEQQQHNQSGSRGNWANRGGQQMRPRGRPRGGGFRNNGPNQGGNGGGNRPRNTLKFENDYDFEQANTEFEELRSQLVKVKIDEASSTASAKSGDTNGVVVVDVDSKKDDSGNETGAGDTEQEEEHESFYDKKKSFFDMISCEAVERAKGKSQRTDWRVERKLNSETFGVSSTRRGHYRGRGGYRGMGYRGGYRQNNYRQPQRNNRDQQQQQQQQSSSSTTAPQQQQQGNTSTEQQHEKQEVAEIKSGTEIALITKQASINDEVASVDALEDAPSQACELKNIPEPVM